MNAHDSSTSTLDPERAQQMRSFLLDEVRHSPAVAPSAARSRSVPSTGRRVLVGIGAASMIGAGLFGVNAVVGGPGPAAVDQAVAIETEGAWTTIRLKDPDATPEAVLAQLEAAGIAARIEEVPTDPSDSVVGYMNSGLSFTSGPATPSSEGAAGQVVLPAAGEGGLVALTVSLPDSLQAFTNGDAMIGVVPNDEIPDGVDLPNGDASTGNDDQLQRLEERWAELRSGSVRLDGDGAISLRTDTEAEVVVVAAR